MKELKEYVKVFISPAYERIQGQWNWEIVELTIKYDWMVASEGRSVMRNFMPLNSIRAGAGRISFCLMLIVVIKHTQKKPEN